MSDSLSGLPLEQTISPAYGVCVEIKDAHLDVRGHTNNVHYVQWMQDVAVEPSSAVGWTAERYLANKSIWVVRSHHVEYRRSTYLGDKLLLQTWIAEMKRASCLRRYRFLALPQDVTEDEIQRAIGFTNLKDFEFPQTSIVATAETHWAFVSTETLRPVRVNPELNAVFVEGATNRAYYPLR